MMKISVKLTLDLPRYASKEGLHGFVSGSGLSGLKKLQKKRKFSTGQKELCIITSIMETVSSLAEVEISGWISIGRENFISQGAGL